MPENKLSVNQDVPVGIEGVSDNKENPIPRVAMEGTDVYKAVIAGLRQQLVELVQEGSMSEVVAERILTDFMYTVFNQIVKVRLD